MEVETNTLTEDPTVECIVQLECHDTDMTCVKLLLPDASAGASSPVGVAKAGVFILPETVIALVVENAEQYSNLGVDIVQEFERRFSLHEGKLVQQSASFDGAAGSPPNVTTEPLPLLVFEASTGPPFLWQAYVTQKLRNGTCAPTRPPSLPEHLL